ncbi:MAG: RadC family protein [Halanaerobiales bacterium]
MCSQSKEYKYMSDKELLDMIVSEKTSNYLLEKYSAIEEIILNTYPQELKKIEGIGNKTCNRIQAIAEIAYRLFNTESKNKRKICSAKDVYEINKDMQHLKQEQVRAIYLNIKNGIIKTETITIGTSTSSLLTPKEVFSRAIRLMAEAVILVHNHPSGSPLPSKDDLNISEKIKKAGNTIGIDLLDHIIIGKGRYISLQEYNGMKGAS